MTHFAKIENNIVVEVIVADQKYIDSQDGEWVETFKDRSKRKIYAGKGYEYNREYDVFVIPREYPSFVFNIERLEYEAPKDIPLDSQLFTWNEELQQWDIAKPTGKNKLHIVGRIGRK